MIFDKEVEIIFEEGAIVVNEGIFYCHLLVVEAGIFD
jgi:hypothetical protein